MIRKTLRFLLIVFAFGYPATSIAATISIASITPSRIPFKKDSTIVLSGKKLGSIHGCAIFPVTGSASAASIPTKAYCTAVPTKSGDQVIVTIAGDGLPVADTYNLILATATIPDGNTLAAALGSSTVIHIANIYAYDPNNASPSATAKGTGTAGNGGADHPYTDCLGQSSGLGAVGNSTVPVTNVLCSSSVIPDSEVSDNFGKHVSQVYSAIQVRVSNKNSQFDFLLRDVVLTLPDGRIISSRIRRLAQGVAVKGKTHDPRSAVFNSLTAAGGVYGALASFGSAGFTTAGNVLQGPFMAAYNQIYPDYTADNVNRFNNAVFDDQNPSIVPKDSLGHPALFVVVLVPKEPHMDNDSSYQSAKNVLVSIEGTFIKQVTLLSLNKTSLSFQPQFVSPPAFTKPFNFTDLEAASESQQVSISNTGSNTLNIHSFSIVPSGGAKNTSSPDFEVDSKNSNCGVGGGAVSASTGATAFTVAPNASCVVAIRFHPRTLGPISATLAFDGDNIEGSASVALNGVGVGLIMQTADTATPPLNHTFGKCSYSNPSTCTFDLGSQNAGSSTPVNVYYYTGNTTDKITVNTVPASIFTSSGVIPSIGAALIPSGTLSVPTPANSSSTSLTLTDTTAAFKTPFNITFIYQTITTAPTSSIVAGVALPYGYKGTVTVGASDGTIPSGQVSYTVTNHGAAAGTPAVLSKEGVTVDRTTGVANVDLSGLVPGSYDFTANFVGTGVYRNSFTGPVNFTVANPMIIGFAAPAGPVPHGVPVSFTANVAINPAVACSGTFRTVVTSGAAGPAIPTTASPDPRSGTGTITFTPPTPGSYTVTLSYEPAPGAVCPAQAQPLNLNAN